MQGLMGRRFGNWIVTGRCGYDTHRNIKWRCQCNCGRLGIVIEPQLLNGSSAKCRVCDGKEIKTKHGRFGTKPYKVWAKMMDRCYNPRSADYADYGGRGIMVCEKWHDAATLLLWLDSSNYHPRLTIDRVNNNGDYCPENCQWSTIKKQSRNRRSNHKVTISGITKLLCEWSEESGINYDCLRWRLKVNWPINLLLAQSGSTQRRKHVRG